jgi:hypothetical protein
MFVLELVPSFLPELVGLLFGRELEPVDDEQKLYVVVFEDLDFLVDVADDRELELCLVVDRGKVGLVEHAHGVDAEPLSAQLTHEARLEGFSDVGVKTFYAH